MTLHRADVLGAAVLLGFAVVVLCLALFDWRLGGIAVGVGLIVFGRTA